MKKLITLLIFLLFFVFVGYSQNYIDVNFPNNRGSYEWQQVGQTCNGCASFAVGVSKSVYPNEYGNYKYEIFYTTNSRDPYGNLRMTYISPIYYYYYFNGQWLLMDNKPYWVLCNNQVYHGYTFWTPDGRLNIKIRIYGYEYR